MAALAWLVSCTLTDGEFRPVEVDTRAVQGTDSGGLDAGGGAPAGAVVVMPAPGSACVDSADCPTERVCKDGTCVTPECVEAEGMSTCAILTCLDGSCESLPSCSDGALGPAETDVDCGGSCGPCALGRACVQAADCQDADCIAGLCVQPTCVDGAPNQDETDVDCGGSCAVCAVGHACSGDTDCASGTCGPDGLCAAPSCADGVRNQTEADVDCGGP